MQTDGSGSTIMNVQTWPWSAVQRHSGAQKLPRANIRSLLKKDGEEYAKRFSNCMNQRREHGQIRINEGVIYDYNTSKSAASGMFKWYFGGYISFKKNHASHKYVRVYVYGAGATACRRSWAAT